VGEGGDTTGGRGATTSGSGDTTEVEEGTRLVEWGIRLWKGDATCGGGGWVFTTVPEIIDPVFTKTSPKRSFCMTENERFGLVFVKTGSIDSGTGGRGKPEVEGGTGLVEGGTTGGREDTATK
jgi:hypothetical protein